METETTIQKNLSQPYIKLNRLSTGKYTWTVCIGNEDLDEMIKLIEDVNKKLIKKFLNN